MELSIGPLFLSDLDAVVTLSRQLGYEVFSGEVRARLARVLEKPDHFLIGIRSQSGHLIAYAHALREPTSLLAPERAELHTLVVEANFRDQGIGGRLLGAAEDWARSQGLSRMRLRSNMKREAAHRFYFREGYAIEKTSHVFTQDLTPSRGLSVRD